jgi:class 3 adenylate cyclase
MARVVVVANLPLGDKLLSGHLGKQHISLEKQGKSDKT